MDHLNIDKCSIVDCNLVKFATENEMDYSRLPRL